MDYQLQLIFYLNTYSAVPLERGQFSPKFSYLAARVRYEVYFVNLTSDAYFASIIVVPYAKSYYVGPRYNDIRLYALISPDSPFGQAAELLLLVLLVV